MLYLFATKVGTVNNRISHNQKLQLAQYLNIVKIEGVDWPDAWESVQRPHYSVRGRSSSRPSYKYNLRIVLLGQFSISPMTYIKS